MQVNFNRSVGFLFILLVVLLTGCSGTSEKPLSLNDQLPGRVGGDADGQYSNAASRLKFGRYQFGNSQHETVWDRLLALYSLPEIEHYRVDEQVEWYLQHPASLAIIQQRAEPYLHHILDEIEAKGIPGELALLPVVESAFQPNAYSHADASGLWQFVPSTGEEYGLLQNDWYDGRRDVYASTKAATTYLKELSETFDGDWLLALASYNCGKGRVRKSIEKNEDMSLPTDYWSLDLPQETVDYVPRLLAIAKIFANADQYNINLRHIPNRPYFEVVDIKAPLDLHKAAQLANTPYDKFIKLNPGFNRSCTAPQGPHRLLVPVENAQSFKRNLAMLPFDERVDLHRILGESVAQTRSTANHAAAKSVAARHEPTPVAVASRYKVRPGDSLTAIAARHHTTVATLKQVNRLPGGTVRSGTNLLIPNNAKAVKTALSAQPTKSHAVGNQVYAVKKGETYFSIARKFSVSPKDLAEWNKGSLKAPLVAGRKLTIKSSNVQFASSSPAVRLIRYTVGKGDTLARIAKKFNVTIGDLRKSNADVLSKGLQTGQKLKVLVASHSST